MSVRDVFGMECPYCSSDGALRVFIHTWAPLTADGTDGNEGEHGWDENDDCRCGYCGHTGAVASFKVPEPKHPDTKTYEVGFTVTDLQVARVEARSEAEALQIAQQLRDANGSYEGDFDTARSEYSAMEVRGIV